jgi:hypothetical protein
MSHCHMPRTAVLMSRISSLGAGSSKLPRVRQDSGRAVPKGGPSL